MFNGKSKDWAQAGVVHAFGYGSNIFNPATKNIDLIMIVEDGNTFHYNNILNNYEHYSLIPTQHKIHWTGKRVQRSGSRMYFHTDVPINSFDKDTLNDWTKRNLIAYNEFRKTLTDDYRTLKYVTMVKEDALNDLKNWETFALAGRTQKPLLDVIDDADIKSAIKENREKALALSIIFNFNDHNTIDVSKLLQDLSEMSYRGDLRMRLNLEHPRLIANMVRG